ncbi:mechanosensitive ion channel protein MscS [candidate division LCP-89 bacterium B3_LCP]|uniref:Mechanosensitive ion channel protein MscS n=1 Tax=candidate division LCP-89 bacterium B3_LCP TaxID=2012998 RepID=A0A532V029_UNCL8|nr:MAG: mechanosensitive ion channel protein MscS [candidate division LCP-89 bacterium B3_LCP]
MPIDIQQLEGNFSYIIIKAAAFIFIAVAAYLLARWLLERILKKLAGKTKTSMDDRLLNATKKPLRFLILAIGASYAVNAFQPYFPENVKTHISGVFYIIITITIAVWIMRLISAFFEWYAETIATRTESKADDEFVPLIVRVAKIVIGIITLIVILKHFNQDVQSLVVSLGVGSLALALAAQETLSNMIAGFVIMTDRPFRVGDRVELSDGKVGDVYQVGLRSTKLMTFANTLIIVPNSEIVKERVINRSYPDPLIRVKINVGVAYSSDVAQVKRILIKAFKDHPEILDKPKPQAYFLNFGDSALEFMAIGRVDSWKKQFMTSDDIRCEIMNRFRSEGIEIPFPQRDIWIRSDQESDAQPD